MPFIVKHAQAPTHSRNSGEVARRKSDREKDRGGVRKGWGGGERSQADVKIKHGQAFEKADGSGQRKGEEHKGGRTQGGQTEGGQTVQNIEVPGQR